MGVSEINRVRITVVRSRSNQASRFPSRMFLLPFGGTGRNDKRDVKIKILSILNFIISIDFRGKHWNSFNLPRQ